MTKMKKLFIALATILSSLVLLSGAVMAAADPTINCTTTKHQNNDPTKGPTVPDVQRQCDPALTSNADYCNNPNVSASNCTLVGKFVQPAVDFLSVLFGIAVVAAIIYGGIEYASSGGDPSKSAAGKNRIRNALIALVAYVFLLALMNFIIPGGVF